MYLRSLDRIYTPHSDLSTLVDTRSCEVRGGRELEKRASLKYHQGVGTGARVHACWIVRAARVRARAAARAPASQFISPIARTQ